MAAGRASGAPAARLVPALVWLCVVAVAVGTPTKLGPSPAVVRRLRELNRPQAKAAPPAPRPAFPRFFRGAIASAAKAGPPGTLHPEKRYTHTMISQPQLTPDDHLATTHFPGYISDKGGTECFGLPDAMCKPCPLGGPDDFCAKAKKACTDHFCYPLCRHITWRCSVDFGDLVEESARKVPAQLACRVASRSTHPVSLSTRRRFATSSKLMDARRW
jgi:hypothetical protein